MERAEDAEDIEGLKKAGRKSLGTSDRNVCQTQGFCLTSERILKAESNVVTQISMRFSRMVTSNR